ncbi:mitochondrial glycoprotein [Diplogelasinospora grovesii]|uniref:Mitochondrial glycoprotein n=1 Tax=Diplogelasinospora grovesii TaxID=303347 RepID=A0AAN6NA78_9PEZI|nr:mitochondrial glycoprotein [Diplogelasinospora grovesii]
MMSLRAFARSAPRAIARASASTSVRPVARTSSSLLSQSASLRLRQPQLSSAFSTSVFRRARAGETDEELSQKLASEIEFEQDVKENEPMPSSVKDFLENGPFEIIDTPGKEDVILKRTFGNEKITVTFSIADLQNYNEDLYEEDPALGDEEMDTQQQQNRNAQEAEEELEGDESPVPCRLNIVVEKPGKGALNIEATAQDGTIVVENLFYYQDAKLALGETAEAAHAAHEVYPGPPFGSLDEDLQILMERYLEERGITQTLAVFVPDYMDMKEQKEYLAWLNNVKGFIDA